MQESPIVDTIDMTKGAKYGQNQKMRDLATNLAWKEEARPFLLKMQREFVSNQDRSLRKSSATTSRAPRQQASKMSSKNFIHSPSQLVEQALRSLPLINPTLVVDEAEKVVRYLPKATADPRVSIISGGGAGHEPAFVGYVGQGLLSAAVSGTIFASPNANQVLHAIENVDATKGILVTVMNYTGDVLNFGVAVERAKVRSPSLRIEMLTIGDDVGVPRSQAGKVGRRGIAGTCLVHKITGAAAAQGRSLDQLMTLGRVLADNLVSVGVSLDRVHVPGQSTTIDADRALHGDEVELGMGIHNEAGSCRRRGAKARLDLLISEMLDQLISQTDVERSFAKTISPEAVLLVNNLGGLSPLELGAITTEASEQLQSKYKITTPRVYSGTFMTSLNGPGFSLSLLFLQPSNYEEIIGMLDFPTEARGWNGPSGVQAWRRAGLGKGNRGADTAIENAKQPRQISHQTDFTCDISSVIRHLQGGLHSMMEAEPEITKFDSLVGDGDCGTTLKRGAEGEYILLSQLQY